MPDNVFNDLREVLRAYMNDKADHIAGGACRTMEEYRHVCGLIEGLAIAERELLDLEKKYEGE